MPHTKAVFAGSFDIVTRGHEWLIRTGAQLFDELVVAIGHNPDKAGLLSIEKRLAMLREITADIPHVSVAQFSGIYTADFARSVEAGYLLRGLRGAHDMAHEQALRAVNDDIAHVETVLLMAPATLRDVSSSMVRSLIGFQGWQTAVARYVPDISLKHLKEKFDA